MCTFKNADHAIQAACSMHEKVEDSNEDTAAKHTPIKIRVGLHFGPVLLEEDDIFGDAVNVAARMVAQSQERTNHYNKLDYCDIEPNAYL